MTAPPTAASVRRAIARVVDPCSISAGVPLDIVEMGLVTHVSVESTGDVRVGLRLTTPGCLVGLLTFEREIKRHVGVLEGVRSILVEYGDPLSWTEDDISERGRALLARHRSARRARLAGGVPGR